MNDKALQFSTDELARYARHLNLPDIGFAGQQKLKAAKVLVVGAGGLGSPLLLYLAAAGVGTIGIVEFDVVDVSNLQRQVLFGKNDVGQSKAQAAKIRLESLNPRIEIRLHETRLTSENALGIIQDYDVVADGSDNFPTRYLVNDACVLLGKPLVFGAVSRFEGQVSVFNWRGPGGDFGPNYRDLHPVPPPPGLVPNCAEAGVLGVLPGIIGSLQALEVIKIAAGVGEPLSGRLFVFDALNFQSRTFNVKCRPDTSITQLIDYEQFCGTKAAASPIREITAAELQAWQRRGEKFQLIDVREPHEHAANRIEGAELIPLGTVAANVGHISRSEKVVVHCQSGSRSAQAVRELGEQFGFDNLFNLKGGIVAYLESYDA
ncbi:MAG: molybdopterin-synthase adenylyltransferase MoeB [Saprospiraceae bacterium]